MARLIFLTVFVGLVNGELFCVDKRPGCRADRRCLLPDYYFNCSRTCGCNPNERCIDESAECFNLSTECFNVRNALKCNRFCGDCNGCYDAVLPRICRRYLHRCNEYNISILCLKTCGICTEKCRNQLKSQDVCDEMVRRGYCQLGHPNRRAMLKICLASCTSGTCTLSPD